MRRLNLGFTLTLIGGSAISPLYANEAPAKVRAFLEDRCIDCHDAETKKGNLDLTALAADFGNADSFAKWVKIHDRVKSGEMPPKKKERPPAAELQPMLNWLHSALVKADQARDTNSPRRIARRLTRAEYENTMRDLFDLPGITLQSELPADGMAHGFDKTADALDISHVNVAKYIEAADKVLDAAIVTRPDAPPVEKQRIGLAKSYAIRDALSNGDAVLLREGKPDPILPIPSERGHRGMREHEQLDLFPGESTVGLFRHEDDAFNPRIDAFAAVYAGHYRVRASLWSFGWDKGKVVPARGFETARLSVLQLQNRGIGGGHPSFTIGYFDAPPDKPQVSEFTQWFNPNEAIGINAASLVPRRVGEERGRTMAYTGPGLAFDWVEVEGPFYEQWPPRGHRLLFGELPIVEWKPKEHPEIRLPKRQPTRQEINGAMNRPPPVPGLWSPRSNQPLADADRLLAAFLPQAFRRPVSEAVRKEYAALVEQRLTSGDCFELAMRWAYRAALCSPDFLYHLEPPQKLDDYALASRLSYLLWNSAPDAELTCLASAGTLREPKVLRQQTERLLQDKKSQRFVEDFIGQWLKLRLIAANDPDKKLYPEFQPYLQELMVAETQAYFRELLEKDLDASHVAKSDFAMLNQPLARLYGMDSVQGSKIRRVALPATSPRGGFLTQGAILKVTANGTTTSPVPRGAFVMDRILGQPPEPPPPNTPAVEPDVRGAATIREQLDQHRHDAVCAGCHAKIDPPGFAMECFDPIGGFRSRYRSIEIGDQPDRGMIDPFVRLGFKLGPTVDPSGELPDGRHFRDIKEFQSLLASDSRRLLTNLAKQILTYGTGREIAFHERDDLAALVAKVEKQNGGIRSLVHEIVQSPLFQQR